MYYVSLKRVDDVHYLIFSDNYLMMSSNINLTEILLELECKFFLWNETDEGFELSDQTSESIINILEVLKTYNIFYSNYLNKDLIVYKTLKDLKKYLDGDKIQTAFTIDQVLDKINEFGMNSLHKSELEILKN